MQFAGQTGTDLGFERRTLAGDSSTGFVEECDDLVSGHGESGADTLQAERHGG
jgi:hypothetical protein